MLSSSSIVSSPQPPGAMLFVLVFDSDRLCAGFDPGGQVASAMACETWEGEEEEVLPSKCSVPMAGLEEDPELPMKTRDSDKTIKLWKITERDKRPEGYNLKDEEGKLKDLSTVTSLQVPVLKPMDLMVEVSPRRVFANGHTYHINSISVNSDCETYMSADDLRINLWHLAITDRSFNIVDIKPANMEDLTEVITASEFHPHHCNLFVYSSSKGSLRLCDMRAAALCDKHSK
ncbi:protein phosphatase 2, regulatory subunit B, gamma, partial [Leptonychotes weddellii]|uniref:Protein phosphatase 2, regulatory subunit B, gamma n=1 Tax=Leptonychotes weddellii TaxID=9713 RepID=A0A2U3YI10_LEPWE